MKLKHKSDMFASSKNYLFVVEGKAIHIYRSMMQEEKQVNRVGVTCVSGKSKFDFSGGPPFIQHKAGIVQMRYCEALRVLISLDE